MFKKGDPMFIGSPYTTWFVSEREIKNFDLRFWATVRSADWSPNPIRIPLPLPSAGLAGYTSNQQPDSNIILNELYNFVNILKKAVTM
jgi:hypothetical protein